MMRSTAVGSAWLPFTQAGLEAVARSTRDKLREVEISVEDFFVNGEATDRPSINRAIAAIPAGGGTVLFNRNGASPYVIDQAIVVSRGNIMLRGKHRGSTTLHSTSLTANHLTIGAIGAAYLFNVHLENIVFTRADVASAGWAIDVANSGYVTFTDLRVYGDNKQYQGIRGLSVSNFYLKRVRTENIQKEAGYFEGLGSSPAVTDGTVVNLSIEDWYNSGCHAGAPNLAAAALLGVVVFGDYCQGIWIDEYACDSHKGYALYLKGTLANRAYNTLIHINQLDVESAQPGGGALRVGAFRAVWIDAEWVSGRDINTVHLESDAQNIFWLRGDIAIAWTAAEAAALFIDGDVVEVRGRVVGYSTNAHGTGVSIGPNASTVDFHGGAVCQLAMAVAVHASSRSGKSISFNGTRFFDNADDFDFDLSAASHSIHVDCPDVLGYINGGRVFRSSDASMNLMEVSETEPTSGNSVLSLCYHNGTDVVFEPVTLGAADSGGTGYRALRVPN